MAAARRGLTLEVTQGITEHANRVALKGVFQAFGDVLSCWIPPIDRRHVDFASVRFQTSEQAEAAKKACDGGQVYFQGIPLKVEFQTGSAPRVGNSDIGGASRGGDRAPEIGSRETRRERSRSRDRRRRSPERDRRRARSNSRPRRARPNILEDAPAPAPPAPEPSPLEALTTQQLQALTAPPPDAKELAAAWPASMIPAAAPTLPTVDFVEEARRKKEIADARAKRTKQGPGVAALVQGALKRAQSAVAMKEKPKEEEEELPPKRKETERYAAQGRRAQDDMDDDEDVAEVPVESAAERARKAAEKAREEAAMRIRKELEEAARREQEAKEALEREREKARRDAEEAERERQNAEKEAQGRDARVKAGVEAAKRRQLEREGLLPKEEKSSGGANAGSVANGSLYSDMPQPLPADEAAQKEEDQRKRREAKLRESGLPPEDRGKIIFLDVDGVLRPARAGGFDTVEGQQASQPDTSDFFPSAMQALRHIVERTGAVIVLSSEWRRSEASRQALDDVLEAHRLRPCFAATTAKDDAASKESAGDPVRSFAERRAREISAYFQNHEEEVKGWVVLDDINLAIADEEKKGGSKGMGPKLVQTWPLCGLTMGNAKTAVRILNGAFIHKVLVERPRAPGSVGPGAPGAK